MFGTRLCSGLCSPVFFCLALLGAANVAIASGPSAKSTERTDTMLVLSMAQLPRIPLQIGSQRITVELAADEPSRQRGLKFRESLAPNHGMLFVFPVAAQYCFWMKDTSIPLTVAFIDATGAIISMADMQPHSLDSRCSMAPATYALEMEQGWFARHGIRPGTRVNGLPRLVRRPVG